MKVSKVVLLVVALHVLVIGGIFVFEGCSRAKAPTPDMAANETPADQTAAANMPAVPPDGTAAQTLTPVPPPATVTPAPVPAAVSRTYAVKKGDTLSKIAKAEHVSIGELARANNLTKVSVLKINQKLTIPAKAETATVAAATPAPAAATDASAPVTAAVPVSGTSYTVKSGDSLWKIAKAQNVSVAAIKQANNLASDSLKINQKLTIPAAAAATATTPTAQVSNTTGGYAEWQPGAHSENGATFHIVDIGESPAVIAKKYGVKVDELMKANNITDTKRIMVGQKLVIPAANAPASTATPAVAAPIVSAGN